jgi:hypothetical protein
MGGCIRIAPPPPQISITLPGGIKIQSQPNSSQQFPNALDPVNSLLSQAAPALGAMQPAFDIVGFVMALMTFMLTLLGTLSIINPVLGTVFPVPTIINSDVDTPIPGKPAGDTGVPDPGKLISDALAVILKGVKLIGLIPHLSMLATVKDTLNASTVVMSGVTAKLNDLSDQMSKIPADTGDPVIDAKLACAREAVADAMQHAAGPLSNLIPILQNVSTMSQPISQGMPASVANLLKFAIKNGLIPLPSDEARDELIGVIDGLQQGTLLDFPDLSNVSDLPTAMNDIREKLAPVLGPLEQVQLLLTKLQNC